MVNEHRIVKAQEVYDAMVEWGATILVYDCNQYITPNKFEIWAAQSETTCEKDYWPKDFSFSEVKAYKVILSTIHNLTVDEMKKNPTGTNVCIQINTPGENDGQTTIFESLDEEQAYLVYENLVQLAEVNVPDLDFKMPRGITPVIYFRCDSSGETFEHQEKAIAHVAVNETLEALEEWYRDAAPEATRTGKVPREVDNLLHLMAIERDTLLKALTERKEE